MAWRGTLFRCSKLALLVLIAVGAAWALIVPPVASAFLRRDLPRVRRQMGQVLQAQVEFRTASFHAWRGVVLEDVRLRPDNPRAPVSTIRVATLESPLRVRLWPRPALELRELILVRPEMMIEGDPDNLRLLLRALQVQPQLVVERPVPVWLRPTAVRMRRGRLTILTPAHPLGPGSQLRFDQVDASLTAAWWFIPAHFVVDGVLGAEPESRLVIRGAVHRRRGATTRVEMTIRGYQFNVARINPYVEDLVHFPEGSVNGVVKIWATPDGRLASSGRIQTRDLGAGQPGLWGRAAKLIASSISYDLKGRWGPAQLRAEEVVVKTAGLRFTGQGEVRLEQAQTRYTAQMASGRIPTRMLQWLFPELEFKGGDIELQLAVEGTHQRLTPHIIFVTQDSTLTDPVHHLTFSKVDGTIDVTQERILIDQLEAFVNDVPVRLSLDVVTGTTPVTVTASLETYPRQLEALRRTNPWVMRASVVGQYVFPAFTGAIEGQVSTATPGREVMQPVEFSIPVLTVELPAALTRERLQTQGVVLSAPALVVRPHTPAGPAPGLTLQELTARATLERNKVVVQQLGGTACQGTFTGKAMVDASTAPGRWEVTARVDHLQLEALWQGLGHPPPIVGELAFDGRVSQSPGGLQIRGWTQVLNGQVQRVTALALLAQETGIEPLQMLTFRELSTTFRFADDVVTVEPFVLEGEQARLRSTCRIGTDGRLAGEISAQFPQEAVRGSSRLRWLMRFVGADPWIDFDFKLAGSLKSLRVQWLPGEFKRKIQDRLSPGLQRMLEEEMDKMLAPPA